MGGECGGWGGKKGNIKMKLQGAGMGVEKGWSKCYVSFQSPCYLAAHARVH